MKRGLAHQDFDSRRCRRQGCDNVFKPNRGNQKYCSRECYQLIEAELKRNYQRSAKAQRQALLTQATLAERDGPVCDCGSALWFSSEPITGKSTYGCARCNYVKYTELYVGSQRYPKTVTPHKRPSYHQGAA